MDFQTCFELLAARPAHVHQNCESSVSQDVELSIHDQEDVKNKDSVVLNESSISSLLHHVFSLQEQRVQIYKEFHTGFDHYHATSQFETFCAAITKQFSHISTQINSIEATLRQKERTQVAQVIRKVQTYEKEKLLLTSALLIEKMRLHKLEQSMESDASVMALLEQSIRKMKEQHTDLIIKINELLEELRIEMLED